MRKSGTGFRIAHTFPLCLVDEFVPYFIEVLLKHSLKSVAQHFLTSVVSAQAAICLGAK